MSDQSSGNIVGRRGLTVFGEEEGEEGLVLRDKREKKRMGACGERKASVCVENVETRREILYYAWRKRR